MRINNPIHVGLMASFVCGLVFCAGSARALGQSADQAKFPYQAFVLNDQATVHSGPGKVHYATEQLTQGVVVEVHREDPGGWCAIRPVEGSFSLIPEATLDIIEEGVGRITENGTQAWVGTKLGPVEKPLWQIKLRKGEMVNVLGQVSWPNPEGHSTIWYQISPPAGEFRWVRLSDIQLPANVAAINSVPPQATHTGSPPNPSRAVRSLNEIVDSTPAIDFNTAVTEADTRPGIPQNFVQQATLQTEQLESRPQLAASSVNINRGWRKASRPIGLDNADDAFDRGFGNGTLSDGTLSDGAPENFQNGTGYDERLTTRGSSPDEIMRIASADTWGRNMAQNLDVVRNQNGFAGTPNPGDLVGQRSQTYSRSISDLELQLTREMIKENPSEWRLEDLETAANAIYRTSQNPTERLMAEKYLAKVANCNGIRAGFRTNIATGTNPLVRRSPQPIGTGVNSDVVLGATYDANGWLTELVRDGGNSKTEYALQDENGKITHHIAPAPGMNLRRYLKSHVGVIGQRGYHSQLKLDHVTAHRIVELEKPKGVFRR